jgi:hypothetical protein
MSSSNDFGVLEILWTCPISKTLVEKFNDNIGAKPYTSIDSKKLEMVDIIINIVIGSGTLLMTSWCCNLGVFCANLSYF